MMKDVVSSGTGTAAKISGQTVAGKTGTARIALPRGGYMDASGRKKHQGSFVGFFPYENPKYSIIVVVYSRLAAKNFYGGTWGGPVACEIIDNIYAKSPEWNAPVISSGAMPQIAEIKEAGSDSTGVPNVKGMGLRDAIYLLESQGYKVESKGRGKIVDMDVENNCVTLQLAEKL